MNRFDAKLVYLDRLFATSNIVNLFAYTSLQSNEASLCVLKDQIHRYTARLSRMSTQQELGDLKPAYVDLEQLWGVWTKVQHKI